MTSPLTRTGRPNTSGTRGGVAGGRPPVLAPDTYDKDNEQQYRSQIQDLQQSLSTQIAAISALVQQQRRPVLQASRTYYVRPDGSDGNDGRANTPSRAFLTLQAAINAVAAIDTGGHAVSIRAADGSYAPFTVSGPFVGDGGNVTLIGNPSVAITGATNATPIVITALGHNYSNGDHVIISGVVGNTAANGAFKVANANIGAGTYALTKEIDGSNVAGNGAYTSGGTCQAPNRCTIAATGAPGTATASPVTVQFDATLNINGFKVSSTNAQLMVAIDRGTIIAGKMQYDSPGAGIQQIWSTRDGLFKQIDSYSISGSGGGTGNLIQASHTGNFRQEHSTGYAIANLTYDTGTGGVLFVDCGEITTTASPPAPGTVSPTVPFQANGFTVTGKKWAQTGASNIQVEGFNPPQDSYIFGSATGSRFPVPVIIAITRDMTAATGNVSYTAPGFKPNALIATGGVNGGTANTLFCGVATRWAGGASGSSAWYINGSAENANFIQATDNTGANSQSAQVASWDETGFTLTWTKTGTPGAGTATFYVMCIP